MTTHVFNEDELFVQFSQVIDKDENAIGVSINIQHDNNQITGVLSIEKAKELKEQLEMYINLSE